MTNELKKPTKPVVIPAMADNEPCEAPDLGNPIPTLLALTLYILAISPGEGVCEEQREITIFTFNLSSLMELNLREACL